MRMQNTVRKGCVRLLATLGLLAFAAASWPAAAAPSQAPAAVALADRDSVTGGGAGGRIRDMPAILKNHAVVAAPVPGEVLVAFNDGSPRDSSPYCGLGCSRVSAHVAQPPAEQASLPVITAALTALAGLAGLCRRK